MQHDLAIVGAALIRSHEEYVAEKIHMFYGGDTVKRYLRWENGRAFAK
jgi:hypothetical protein